MTSISSITTSTGWVKFLTTTAVRISFSQIFSLSKKYIDFLSCFSPWYSYFIIRTTLYVLYVFEKTVLKRNMSVLFSDSSWIKLNGFNQKNIQFCGIIIQRKASFSPKLFVGIRYTISPIIWVIIYKFWPHISKFIRFSDGIRYSGTPCTCKCKHVIYL